MRRAFACFLFSLLSCGRLFAGQLSPCDAFGAARAVFIGEAGAPVRRSVTYSNGLRSTVKLSPVAVERAFRGVASDVMYIMPAGAETYLSAGERYLIYGRDYGFPNIVMSGPAYGSKLLRDATRDLGFLDVIAVDASGVTINGALEVDESDVAHIGSDVRPLSNVTVRLSSSGFTGTVVTDGEGRFMLKGAPTGVYTAQLQLPDLALNDVPTPTISLVSPGGCGSMPLRAVPNGRIHGFLKNANGGPAVGDSVALMSADLAVNEPDRFYRSIHVDAQGRFEFARVRPGRYILGRLSFQLNGEHVDAVYYPGVATRSEAVVIEVGRSATQDVGAFLIPNRY